MSNLKEGEDYYFNKDGFMVFTAAHHLKRGSCCGNGCLHCPYTEQKQPPLTFRKIGTGSPKERNHRSEED
jgi:hypothetical protein